MLGKIDTKEATTTKSVFELAALNNQWTPDALTENVGHASEPSDGEKTGNTPNSKHRRYHIDPKDMLRVQKQARAQGLSIIGVYHSHPDHVAEPSECDRALAWPEYAYVIVSVHGPRARSLEGRAPDGHGKENAIKAVDVQNWALDSEHQFQPEAIRVSPSSARDRMPVSA